MHIEKTHIAYLDTIRGLAALTVVSEHFVIAYGLPCEGDLCRQWLDYSPLHIWWDGIAAVSMFFVLSGLVLSLKYFRTGAGPVLAQFALSGYALNRMLRIWLPYCVILFMSAFLYLATVNTPPLPTPLPASEWVTLMWRGHPLTLVDMLREAFLLHLPPLIVLIPQSWTLSIELVLSLLLPVGLLLAQRGILWLLFFAVLAVTLLGVSVFLVHFLIGLLLAKYHKLATAYLVSYRWRRRLILVTGLFFYTAADSLYVVLNDTGLWLASGLGAGMILLFVLGSVRAQTLLSHPGLRYIGKVSYSLYLLHMAVLMCLTPILLQILGLVISNRLGLWLGGWLATVALSLFLSLLSYHWLELPCMAMGKRLSGFR
ncbi:MAG: acyltransferase [Methylovulum sp.]|nr:acyltransferase [Methylovulum sp.]